ncbi:MAG: heparinase II/III family protein, partial [Aestuariivirgaceae bacterium]
MSFAHLNSPRPGQAASIDRSAGRQRSFSWLPNLKSAKVTGLTVAVRRLTLADPSLGKQMYYGRFRCGGIETNCQPGAIFNSGPTDQEWIEALHGFSWLAHVEATALELGRVQARVLVTDWLKGIRRHPAAANTLPVLCSRLTAWIFAAPFLLGGADEKFRHLFYAGLTRQIRDLHWRAALARSAETRLDCAVALALSAVALKGLEASRPAVLLFLSEMLDRQIFPDGGHVSGNPAELVRLLLILLPLRLACEEARMELPPGLQAAVDRMLPMLRFFLHGDNGLAIFHGASDPLAAECTAILAADSMGGRPLSHAVHSAYARLAHGSTVLICDTGVPSAGGRRRALSPLAFEFSDAGCRIVVNCGAPVSKNVRLLAVSALPEAHSTAVLTPPVASHTSSRRLLESLGLVSRPAPPSTADVGSSDIGVMIDARHNAYERDTGFIHERRIFLSTAGDDLRGEDSFLYTPSTPGAAETSFAIRFHLHPAVKATLAKGATSVILLLPNRSGWKFSARGAAIRLEESICLWGRAGPRKTMQILLTGMVTGPVNWA